MAPRTLLGSLFLDLRASKLTPWTAATKSKRESLARTPAKDPAKDPRKKSGPPKRTKTISGAAVSRKRPKYIYIRPPGLPGTGACEITG